MKKEVIALGVGAAIVLAGLGYFLLKPEMTINENQIIEKMSVLEEIERDKDKIISKGYVDLPKNVWFMNNEMVTYEGNHSVYGDSQYVLSIESLTLEKNKSLSEDTLVATADEHLITTVDGKGLFVKPLKDGGTGLLLRGETDYYITETLALTEEREACVVLSSDLSKLIYLRTDGKIYTYHFAKDKFARINREVAVDEFLREVSLSDDGGYVCIQSLVNNTSERQFDIYGADSGSRYGQAIMGFSPTFSGDYERIYYLYTGDISDDSMDGKRLGRYDFSKRQFSYVDQENEREIFNQLIPVGSDALIYFVGYREGDGFRIDKVKKYQFSEDAVITNTGFENLVIDEKASIEVLDELVIFKTKDGIMHLYDSTSNALRALGDLDTFTSSGQEVDYVKTEKGFYVNIANRIYLLNVSDKRLVYEGTGQILEIAISPQQDKMAIVVKENDNYDVVVVYLD